MKKFGILTTESIYTDTTDSIYTDTTGSIDTDTNTTDSIDTDTNTTDSIDNDTNTTNSIDTDTTDGIDTNTTNNIGTDTTDSIATFFLFFYVRLRFRRADNLFYVEENLIKISPVCWKYFLAFFGRSIRGDYKYECELPVAASLI